ncbi:MAG: hypothetical protein AAF556_10985 [Pseudomonadota bacterium]
MNDLSPSDWMRVIGNSIKYAVGIDFSALARHASYSQAAGPQLEATHRGGVGRKGGGSYAALAEALHDTPMSMLGEPRKPSPPATSPPVTSPPVSGLPPKTSWMSPREREKARIKDVVDRAIEGSYARGTMDRETADALLEGRYSQWLESKRGKPQPPEDELAKPSFTPWKSPPF